jgi:hypothetical protein
LVFSWWLCGTYTGIFRQELQKRYHLEVKIMNSLYCSICCVTYSCANNSISVSQHHLEIVITLLLLCGQYSEVVCLNWGPV